jgi:hypothetical protein
MSWPHTFQIGSQRTLFCLFGSGQGRLTPFDGLNVIQIDCKAMLLEPEQVAGGGFHSSVALTGSGFPGPLGRPAKSGRVLCGRHLGP